MLLLLFSSCFHFSQIKEINTIFLHGVSGDGMTFKLSFTMRQVTGCITGEVLNEKFLMKMFKIRDLDGTSAYDRTEDTLKSYKNMHKEKSPEEQYHFLHAELTQGKCKIV